MSVVTEQIPEHIAAIAKSAPPSAPELIEFCYQRLVEEGVKPEYKKIRERISRIRPDGKGPSYTAMSPLVKALKLKERASAQVVVAEMPQQLTELLSRIGDNFWRSAMDLADEKVEAVQKAAKQRVQEAEEEFAQFQEENQRLDRDLDALKETLAKISREKEVLSTRLQGSLEEKARLEGERGGLLSDKERLEKTLEEEKERHDNLQELLKDNQDQRESLQGDLSELKEAHTRLCSEKERLEAVLEGEKEQNEKISEQMKADQKGMETLRSELAGAREDFSLLKLESQKLAARADDRDLLASEKEKLTGEVSGMKAELKAISMQEKRITAELGTLRSQHEKTLVELGQWKEKRVLAKEKVF